LASRREFFSSLLGAAKREDSDIIDVVRPPYAKEEILFLTLCKECTSKKCKDVCPEKIIVIDAKGAPILNFSKSGCTFCQECAIACEEGVLSLELKEEINAKFKIDTNLCLAHKGSICFSCKEPCIYDAILFVGLFNPVIDNDLCVGCGFCLNRCPTNAISYTPTKIVSSQE